MSLICSLVVFSSPLFSWADSLYLDPPRLGMIEDYASSGRICQWLYTDIAVLERNSASRWAMGLRPIPLGEQRFINELVSNPGISRYESPELKKVAYYWIGDSFYSPQYYQGPWKRVEQTLAGLAPSCLVDVREGPMGAGAQAIQGTLYMGEDSHFQSASGTYRLAAPAPDTSVRAYLGDLAECRSQKVEELALDGILYLQGSSPLFFYLLEQNL